MQDAVAHDVLTVARKVLAAAPYGFLVTCGGPRPAARLVQHLDVEEDCSVWIGTSPRSRKVRSCREAPDRVLYAVEDRSSFAYVSVHGSCAVVEDEARREQLWEEGLAAFFPDGPLGDDFVLLHLQSEHIEVMSFAEGVHPDPYGLSAQGAARDGPDWKAFLTSPRPG